MQRNTRNELAPFFGNDGRADLFIKLFVLPTASSNYSVAINEQNPRSIFGTFAGAIMTAGEYADKQGKRDDDIHPEFENFIKTIGAFHKQLEKDNLRTNQDAKQFLESIQNVSEDAKKFYNRFISIVPIKNSNSKDLTVFEYNIIRSDLADYRLNIKKNPTEFLGSVNFEPLEPSKSFDFNPENLSSKNPFRENNEKQDSLNWSSTEKKNDESLKQTSVPTAKLIDVDMSQNGGSMGIPLFVYIIPLDFHLYPNYLRDIYLEPFLKSNFEMKDYKPKPNAIFNVRYDNLVRHRIYKLVNLMKNDDQIPDGDFISLADKNIWRRDEDGRLCMITQNGLVFYDEDSPATINALKSNFKCYSTLVNAKNTASCNNYVSKCLINNEGDLKECLDQLNSEPDFFKVAKDDITSMNPYVAMRTLQKFRFRKRKEYDEEAREHLYKIESCSNWLANVVNVDDSFKQVRDIIKSSNTLLVYLSMIVEYVNANPAIMNPNYRGITSEMIGVFRQSDLAKNLGIPAKIEPKGLNASAYDYHMLRLNHMNSYANLSLKRQRSMQGLSMGSPYVDTLLNVASPIGIQMGGGSGFGYDLNTYFRKLNSDRLSGTYVLYTIISETMRQLEDKGIVIDKNDKANLTKKMEEITKLENELLKVQFYLEEFRNYIELFGNYSPNIKTIANIKSIVDRERKLITNQERGENGLMQIFGKLQSILETINKKDSPVQYTQI